MCMVRSLSGEGKEVIRGYMENGKEYDRKELVAAIREKAERKSEMTDGVIAGVIKMLTASGEIVVVSRGRYRKGFTTNSYGIQEKALMLFNRFKNDLDKICMVNVLNLDEDDFSFLLKLNEVCNRLEGYAWELEDFRKERETAGREPDFQVAEIEKENTEESVVTEKLDMEEKAESAEQNGQTEAATSEAVVEKIAGMIEERADGEVKVETSVEKVEEAKETAEAEAIVMKEAVEAPEEVKAESKNQAETEDVPKESDMNNKKKRRERKTKDTKQAEVV